MKRTKAKRVRSGCSGLGALIFLFLAVGAIIGWPIYLDTHGSAAPAVITEKVESVRIEYAEWFRRFEVMAAYSIPGQPLQHRASCDVDEKTYDSLHPGNTVQVHYFARLLNQPFLPATHLSPCSTSASISWNPAVMHPLLVSFICLLAILFLWRVLRIRTAVWLMLPLFCWSFAYLGLPRVEPEPQHPVPGTATIDTVRTVTTLGDTHTAKSIPLQYPYQIMRLKFVPPGMDTAVIAIDKVDVGSVPNLKEGQSAKIVYDAEHPRIARLQQGTRLFPGHALTTVTLWCVAFAVLVAIAGVVGGFFRLLRRKTVT